MAARSIVLNLAFSAGLSMLGVGLWWLSPGVSLAVVGGVLLASSIYGATR